MGSEYLAKPSIQTEIRRQLEISGLTDQYLDTSTERLIEAGLRNSKWTKPTVALQAIAMVNKLKDRYPATRVLTANLQVTAELEGKDTPDLIKLLKDIQLQNKKLMDRVEGVEPETETPTPEPSDPPPHPS